MRSLAGGVFAIILILMLIVLVAMLVLWVMALVDCLKYTEADYQRVGSSRTTWILLIVLLGGIGGLVYWLTMRPKLRANLMGPGAPGQHPQQYGY